MTAARTGDPKKVRAALRRPRDRPDLAAALRVALNGKHLRLLPALVGACDSGFTEARAEALLLAARKGSVGLVRTLLALPEPQDVQRAFLHAVHGGRLAVVRVFAKVQTARQRGVALRAAVAADASSSLVRLLCVPPRDAASTAQALLTAAIRNNRRLVEVLVPHLSIQERLSLLSIVASNLRAHPEQSSYLHADRLVSASLPVAALQTLPAADRDVLPATRARVEEARLSGVLPPEGCAHAPRRPRL